MTRKTEDRLIVLVGGPLFGVLFHWKFPEASSTFLAIAVGLVIMILVVALRRLLGDQTVPRFLVVSFAMGAMIGLAVWWLTGRQAPWYFYALPCGLFVVIAGGFERLTERRRSASRRESDHRS